MSELFYRTSSVEFLRADGSDLDVVNAARTSFDKESDELTERDVRLLHFLARGVTQKQLDEIVEYTPMNPPEYLREYRNTPIHWAPFAHVGMSLRITAPIFIMRQLVKTGVGAVVSEVSRRYVSSTPEVCSLTWRQRPEGNIKQGSGDTFDWMEVDRLDTIYYDAVEHAVDAYEALLEAGVAPEQARSVLPQGVMTEVVMTATLYTWIRLIKLRDSSHAQAEIAVIARNIRELCEEHFPHSTTALLRY